MQYSSRLAVSAVAMAAALVCVSAGAQTFSPTLSEYNLSTSVVQLGIKGIHSKGILGQGVLVAVLDSGINLANPEFKNNPRIVGTYNAVTGSADVTDTMGHGTHIAGIVGAGGNGSGMYGVAPLANLLAVNIFKNGLAYSSDIDRGLLYAQGRGARVINLSIGGSAPTGDAALRRVTATNNTLVVIAAGNDGRSTASWPARYANQAWALGNIIAVGAVDANKNITSYSNRAGDIANWYLVAPGSSIVSSYGTGYAYMSGTSMAAPAVSGAAALLFGYWPYLKSNQVAQILLNTADDLGAKGVDAVYGRGMLNVNRALAPVGSYTYKASNGANVTIPLTGRSVVSSVPKVVTPSAFGGLVTQVFDEYGRNFTSDEGSQLGGHSVTTVASLLGQTDYAVDTAERVMSDGSRFVTLAGRSISVRYADPEQQWNPAPKASNSMLAIHLAGGQSLAAGDGGLSNMALGLMDSRFAPALAGAEPVVANPLTGFAPAHRFASMAMPLGAGWTARSAFVRSKATEAASADINLAEVTKQTRGYALNVSYGSMSERGLLGGYSTNTALGLSQQTATRGVTFSGAYALGADWTLAGSYSTAYTSAPQAMGILEGGTGIRSTGYGVGLVKADTWRSGDRWSFMINAPLRAKSGSLTYSVVDHVDDDGAPVYAKHVVDLKGTARELVAETRYTVRLSAYSSLTAAAAMRHHPDHDINARSETIVGVRYALTF